MARYAVAMLVSTLAVLSAGCVEHHDAVLQGNANGVTINYYGDVGETEPLARQFCARYERAPALHETKENNAYYFCVPPADASRPRS